MFTHLKYRNRLGAYLDGELTERERASMERHVKVCDSCRTALNRLRTIESLLVTVDVPPVPSGLSARVMAAAWDRQREATPAAWSLLTWWRMSSAGMRWVAVGMLILGSTIGLILGGTTSPPVVRATTVVQTDLLDMYQLDYLGDLPAGSLADSYLALVVPPDGGGR